jgi:Flp pilus assembly protein TadG
MYSRCRKGLGSYLVETAATIALVVPLCFYAICVGIEACQVYGISQGLQQAARESARLLASTYAVDPGIVGNTGDQTTYGFLPVINSNTLTGVVADTSQFTADFNTTTPASVTVTVTYASGKYGLATFPSIDPLFLGQNYQLKASATYTLE